MSVEGYRVVFRGRVLAGFDEGVVRSTAERRLKVSSDMISRMFSGRSVILKKDLSLGEAERYVSELRAIGMDVQHEAPKAAPAPQAKAPQFPALHNDDSARTLVADSAALNRYLDAASDYTGQESVMPKGSPSFPPLSPAAAPIQTPAPAARPKQSPAPAEPAQAPPVKSVPPRSHATPAVAVSKKPAPASESSGMASPFGAAGALSDTDEHVSARSDLGVLVRKLILAGVALAILGLVWWMM